MSCNRGKEFDHIDAGNTVRYQIAGTRSYNIRKRTLLKNSEKASTPATTSPYSSDLPLLPYRTVLLSC